MHTGAAECVEVSRARMRAKASGPSSPAIARRERTRCMISGKVRFLILRYVSVVCLVARCFIMCCCYHQR